MIATFAEIAGASLPAGAGEDSISFLPALQGRSQARPPLVMHSINGVFAIRSGDWKFIESNGSGGWTRDQVPEEAQLYNLRDDPGEERNLYSSQKERAAALHAELNKLRR
jgi:arylsulfatase A-like enzyme